MTPNFIGSNFKPVLLIFTPLLESLLLPQLLSASHNYFHLNFAAFKLLRSADVPKSLLDSYSAQVDWLEKTYTLLNS